MRRIAFDETAKACKPLFDRAEQLLARHPRADASWQSLLREARQRLEGEGKLQIALIGQFNAGKSSLIKALTGVDVYIDADEATKQVSSYAWHGLVLLDTPGVQAQVDATPHDELSRQATARADLVLFVVSTELFNERLAKHFQWAAGGAGLGLAGKMAVVVNKIDREASSSDVIRAQVAAAIAPHTRVPIYLCSARMAIDAERWPEQMRHKLWEDSRFDALIAHIDEFAQLRGVAGRLATPLQMLTELLEAAAGALATDSSMEGRSAELLKRKRALLQKHGRIFDGVVSDAAIKIHAKASTIGEACVRGVRDDATQEGIQGELDRGLRKLSVEVDAISRELAEELEEVLSEADEALEALGATPLARAVANDAALRVAHEHGRVEVDDGGNAERIQKVAKSLQPHVRTALEHLAKSPEALHETLLAAGKLIGFKFRPWQAVKSAEWIAKSAGRAGAALPFLGIALEAYLAHHAEEAEDKRRADLARARTGVHRTFSDQGDIEVKMLRAVATDIRRKSLERELEDAEGLFAKTCERQAEDKTLAREFLTLHTDVATVHRRLLGDDGDALPARPA